MDSIAMGDLVKVTEGSAELDGIVFDTPSHTKAIVAVVDPTRGPVLRTFHPDTLSERTTEGPNDRALHLLIRRTPTASHGTTRAGTGGAQRRAGFQRGTAHRPTGR